MDRLDNTVRDYAWGSATALPGLLGRPATGAPQAELWMGAHPGAPSRVDRGAGPVALDAVIAADPVAELGAGSVERFGPTLPFLLKVLAAAVPLSLQVHPTLAQARAGFAAEEARGVPVDAPQRNYRDANHKPELICALGDLEGLCGFRAPADAADLMASLDVPGLEPLVELLRTKPEPEALAGALAGALALTGPAGRATVEAVARAVTAGAASDPTGALAGYAFAAAEYPGDPGLVAALLLNHVRLADGEALYLGAGLPHAYLRGTGIEIMANSDNVLRCGFTPKHVDVPELLKVVGFRSGLPEVLRPAAGPDGERLYPVPVDEFRLSRHELADRPAVLPGSAPQILLCTAGTARLTSGGKELTLHRGESAFLPATGTDTLLDGPGATVFRATVTLDRP
ncbi:MULTISPECIES: mannose-6-phosphate isomerase, class I [Kitasatospora]|uniref:mannose-6-phosphate isomerase n=1 Tax=Kitasatospora setae (strain ATCC 33774 / DSM 43861 / JCM 3304 / KCC A-0304 / NBRC 14216 / KM-6054) TaxID=452652 RepID=E4MZA2_KITSK|nr:MULTISPECIES: mannose-6-phosphate isomerase, class I [Kitasatospora]BAJ29676.1 putative mannose-6-phosphate isomerase [Kitasatospora setae KM-6054]